MVLHGNKLVKREAIPSHTESVYLIQVSIFPYKFL